MALLQRSCFLLVSTWNYRKDDESSRSNIGLPRRWSSASGSSSRGNGTLVDRTVKCGSRVKMGQCTCRGLGLQERLDCTFKDHFSRPELLETKLQHPFVIHKLLPLLLLAVLPSASSEALPLPPHSHPARSAPPHRPHRAARSSCSDLQPYPWRD